MAVCSAVPPGRMMLQLTLDVGEQAAGPEAEQLGPEPAIAQPLLDHREPVERLLGTADPTRRLEPHEIPGAVTVFANLPRHHDAEGQRGVDALLAGGRFDEIGAG